MRTVIVVIINYIFKCNKCHCYPSATSGSNALADCAPPLKETILILDRSQLGHDQSGHLFPDWLWESDFPVNHTCEMQHFFIAKEGSRGEYREGTFFLVI